MQGLISFFKRIPFYQGLSVYDVAIFFWHGLYEGAISSRAASISFSFFLALFPGVIFLFTLIPFIPVAGFQAEVFNLIQDIMPPNSFEVAQTVINDIINIKRGDLLMYTIIATLFFATNGTLSLIGNMGLTVHNLQIKGFWSQYLAAVILTLVLSVLLIMGITMIIYSQAIISDIWSTAFLGLTGDTAVSWARNLILVGLILVSVSLLFYYGPAKKAPWRIISPGAILSTLLVMASSSLFGLYVQNFSTYNHFYGSISTLLIILLWIYINAFGLLIGFELNAGVAQAKNVNSQSKT